MLISRKIRCSILIAGILLASCNSGELDTKLLFETEITDNNDTITSSKVGLSDKVFHVAEVQIEHSSSQVLDTVQSVWVKGSYSPAHGLTFDEIKKNYDTEQIPLDLFLKEVPFTDQDIVDNTSYFKDKKYEFGTFSESYSLIKKGCYAHLVYLAGKTFYLEINNNGTLSKINFEDFKSPNLPLLKSYDIDGDAVKEVFIFIPHDNPGGSHYILKVFKVNIN